MTDTIPNPNVDETGAFVGDSAFQGPQQTDYFGFQEFHKYYFPDGQSWIQFERMNEGKKAKFQKGTSRDLVLERRTGDARLKVDPGGDRHALIKACCTDWNLKRQGQPVAWTDRNMNDWLELTDPILVEELEKAIRKANPWLMAEMTVADIDREIENLQEMRAVAEEREKGEASSASK